MRGGRDDAHGRLTGAALKRLGSACGGRRRLRGWGGVGAMAAACALTPCFAAAAAARARRRRRAPAGRAGRRGAPRRSAARLRRTRRTEPAARRARTGRRSRRSRAAQGTRQADRRRRPEQLPLGLPRPERTGGELEGFDIDLVHAHRQGHPRRPGRRHVPGHPHQPAHRGDPERQGRHGRPHDDDHLRPAQAGRLLRRPTSRPASRCSPRGAPTITGYDDIARAARGSARRRAPPRTTQLTEDRARAASSTPPPTSTLTVPNQLDCLVRLQLGEVDAVVTDNALAAEPGRPGPDGRAQGRAVHRRSTTAWR